VYVQILQQDRAFVDACLGQGPPPVTVQDAFHSIAVLDAAYASVVHSGEFLDVPRA
jgi:predicted dehydrogenase